MEALFMPDTEGEEAIEEGLDEALVDAFPLETHTDEDSNSGRDDKVEGPPESTASYSSSSSNSDDEMDDVPASPTPPDVPAMHAGARPAPKPATYIFQFMGYGSITVYNRTQRMVATCNVPAHGHRCFKIALTREHATDIVKYPAQGRPIGMLAAWLMFGHKNHPKKGDEDVYSHADRVRARLVFEASPGADLIFEEERALRPGEPREPLEHP